VSDTPRYLGRTGGYAPRPTIDALEAVDEDEQRRQTAQAHLRWKKDLARDWGRCRTEVLNAVQAFTSSPRVNGKMRHHVRQITRTIDRIDSEIGR
jgi:hypothetical protein